MKLSFIDPTSNFSLESNRALTDYIVTKCESGKAIAFQFYSLLMYGIPVPNLIPRKEVIQYLFNTEDGDELSREFDIRYADQLVNDKLSFFDLVSIMSTLQSYDEVIVISNYMHPNVTPIIDSLIKFIQQRYGIESFIVNAVEDIDPYSFSEFKDDYRYGVYISDVEWFISQVSSDNDIKRRDYLIKTLRLYNIESY